VRCSQGFFRWTRRSRSLDASTSFVWTAESNKNIFASRRFFGVHQRQLHIIESLPFAPLEKHNIAIEHCYTAIMGLEFLYDAFQAGKACRTVRQNLNPVSNLITWHRVQRFLHCQPLYVLPKQKRQNSSLGFVKIWLKQQSASVQSIRPWCGPLNAASELKEGTMRTPMEFLTAGPEKGAIGYILLWALGVPISVLVIIFLLRGCT
jgi:hypothetical protein